MSKLDDVFEQVVYTWASSPTLEAKLVCKERIKELVLGIVEESKDKALPLAYITKTVSDL